MSQERIILEQEKQSNASNGAMVGALVFMIILGLLYVSGIAHSFTMLFKDPLSTNKGARTGLFVGSLLLPPPLYWFVFLIVKYSGGLKQ